MFGDAVVATTILDAPHSQVITLGGDRYRLCAKRKAGLIKPDSIHHHEQVVRE